MNRLAARLSSILTAGLLVLTLAGCEEQVNPAGPIPGGSVRFGQVVAVNDMTYTSKGKSVDVPELLRVRCEDREVTALTTEDLQVGDWVEVSEGTEGKWYVVQRVDAPVAAKEEKSTPEESATAESVTVPNVVGGTPVAAKKALDEVGLRLATGTPNRGTVVHQVPKAGESAPIGTSVRVEVKAPKPAPSDGMTIGDAREGDDLYLKLNKRQAKWWHDAENLMGYDIPDGVKFTYSEKDLYPENFDGDHEYIIGTAATPFTVRVAKVPDSAKWGAILHVRVLKRLYTNNKIDCEYVEHWN